MCQKLTCQLAACLMCCQCSYYFSCTFSSFLFFPFLAWLCLPLLSSSDPSPPGRPGTYLPVSVCTCWRGCWQWNQAYTAGKQTSGIQCSLVTRERGRGVLEKYRPTPGSIKRQKIWGQSSAISCQSQTPLLLQQAMEFLSVPLGFS